MDFIKVAWSDISSIAKNRIIRASVVGIIIVPLLYSLLYLYAFWDPYGKLDKLPVAVVNLDKGGIKDGVAVNEGKTLTDTLKSNKGLKWYFTNAKKAKDGLEGKKYYATYTIPEDFTASALSAQGKNIKQPKLVYTSNQKRNFLASVINDSKVQASLEALLSKDLAKVYSTEAFGSLDTIKGSIGEAAKASNTLSDGIGTANSYVNQISNGLYQLNSNVPILEKSINDLYNGSAELSTNLKQFQSGADNLSVGLGTAYSGSKQVSDGMSQVASNLNGLNSGMTDLNEKLTTMANSLKTTDPNAYAQLSAIISGYTSSSTGKLALGLSNMGSKVNNQLVPATNSITSGTLTLRSGADKMAAGMVAASSGASTLNNGLSQIKSQMPTLSSSLNQLYSGSKQLSDGVGKISAGSEVFSNQLTANSAQLNEKVVNDGDTMGNFIGNGVKVEADPINRVKNYGTGFAPYFISLSLYIGAMLMFFVITDKVDPSIKAGKISVVIGKFFSYGYIGIIQAVFAAIIVLVLGLKPNNMILYFLFMIFMSYVFIALIQCLVFLLGSVGRMLAIVLLVLDLTACNGTFPNELVPKFFNVINPFLPFTYTVSALREIISGTDYGVLGTDFAVLLGMLFVFLTVSVLFKDHADKVQEAIEEKKNAIVI